MDEDVLELPRILQVKIRCSELGLMVLEGVPLGVESFYRADVVVLNLKALFVVHLIGFYETCFGVL